MHDKIGRLLHEDAPAQTHPTHDSRCGEMRWLSPCTSITHGRLVPRSYFMRSDCFTQCYVRSCSFGELQEKYQTA